MGLSNDQVRQFTRRLLQARMRLLSKSGFYGLLLMNMGFRLESEIKTASTDGKKISFNPEFLSELSDKELDYVLLHETLHAALEHCQRCGSRDKTRFDLACDIVVNSHILYSYKNHPQAISIHGRPGIHQTPDGQEGYLFTAEQAYAMLGNTLIVGEQNNAGSPTENSRIKSSNNTDSKTGCAAEKQTKKSSILEGEGLWDDHSQWKSNFSEASEQQRKNEDADIPWRARLLDACNAEASRGSGYGLQSALVERLMSLNDQSELDWRELLADFISQIVMDYSFQPPDRRFQDSSFFLPDFNLPDEAADDILVLIDTSGSMSDELISKAGSEVLAAIRQFEDRLHGWLAFFDADFVPPVRFESEEQFRGIRVYGGGGTVVDPAFKWIRENMQDKPPACIIVLTDGVMSYPTEEAAAGIPVMWVINTDHATPPWGRIIRINAKKPG